MPEVQRTRDAVRRATGARAACLGLGSLVLLLAGCREATPAARLAEGGPEALAALAVEAVAPADSVAETRTAFLSDGAGGMWFDAVAGPAAHAASGYTVAGQRVLDGWAWWLDADSLALAGGQRERGVARPDFVARAYAARDSGGVVAQWLARLRGARVPHLAERVTLLDGRPGQHGALVVEVADSVGTVGFRPLAGDRAAPGAFRVQRAGNVLLFARADLVPPDSGAAPPAGPIWTAAATSRGRVRAVAVTEATPEGERDRAFALGEIALETPGRLAIATGPTPAAAARAATDALARADARLAERQQRQAALVEALGFATEDEATTRAVHWAALTLDALTVRDSSRLYVQPGVPGATPATFPTVMTVMPALLATGQWEAARDLLGAVGAAQRFDRQRDLLGRAPDLVAYGAEPVFATADGTALFLAAAGDYVRTTGDRGIVGSGPNFWFKTVFALRGVYEPDRRNGSALDTLGFLTTTSRRGTWADGAGDRAFRRRGSPAEAQGALWQALQTASAFSRVMGVGGRPQSRWYADTSRVLARLVDERFGRGSLLADRVEGVGQPVADVRPGGLLLLARMPALPRRAARARALAERLVYPYGVGTVAQTDSLFHPFLTEPGVYAPETARTSGAVWTWLAGPVATLMAETGGAAPAADLLEAQASLLLERGTVGALPELVAAHARSEDLAPETGGAPVQPWSVATYLEGVYRGLLGVAYPAPDTLAVAPRLPERWGATRVRLRLGRGYVRLALSPDGAGLRAEVTPEGALAPGATLRLTGGSAVATLALAEAQGDSAATPRAAFTVVLADGAATVNGQAVPADAAPAPGAAWDGFAFATPALGADYAVMRTSVEQRTLTPALVLRDDLAAGVVLTQTDPDGDDWGATSTYVYPEGVPAGVLDATYLEVARDDTTTFFRAEFTAVDSARPPPTFVAVVIDTEEGGERTVGRNARYRLGPNEGYEYVIFAGDGLVVEDHRGRELGRLASGSVFDAETGSLAFALPTFLLPPLPRGTRVTLLVGALDRDDGEAFLPVEREASASAGGGRVDASAPTIYDVVTGRTR